jgi:CRP-like cAMP-binding protein
MVQIEGLGPTLAQHPFFAGMDPGALETVVGCCANAVFRPGHYIFREGGAADHFYLIRDGIIALEIHVPGRDAVVVEKLGSGEIFGWSWLVSPYMWTSDARAADNVRLIAIDGACLRRKMEADRVLGYELYKRFVPIMARRLASNHSRIVELATEPATI